MEKYTVNAPSSERLAKNIRDFWHCESGATAIEYAFIGSLVSIAIVGSALLLDDSVGNLFNTVALRIVTAINGSGAEPPG